MKRRYKIAGSLLGTMLVAIAGFALYLGRTDACPTATESDAGASGMNAIVHRCYGPADTLKLERVARPVPADDQLLIKVHAAAVNPLDWHVMRGDPYIMRMDSGVGAPKRRAMGVDYAGTVEAVGKSVTRFKPGDEVFGGHTGAFAEFLAVGETSAIARKPANLGYAEAAAIPVAAVTALQALREQGRLEPGQKVLVNGASGGVGTYAVQIAKAMGAEVTGVCSTRNVEMVASLGADRVLDYRNVDFTAGDRRYDLIVDTVGNRSLREIRRVLEPRGTYVIVGAPSNDRWLGPLTKVLAAKVYAPFVDQPLKFFVADLNAKDLAELGGLAESGRMRSVIDRRYPLAEVPSAIAYVEEGHARGKVVIDVAQNPSANR